MRRKEIKRYIININPELFSKKLKEKNALRRLNNERKGNMTTQSPVRKTTLPANMNPMSRTYS